MSTKKTKRTGPDSKIYAAERLAGGYLDGEYKKTSSITLENLLEMREEPTIKMGIWFYNAIVKGAISEYIHPDDNIQEFVKTTLESIQFKSKLSKILSYRWVGATASEIIWESIEGKWNITDLVYLRPETWYKKGLPVSPTDPIIQEVEGGDIEIPVEKCMIIRNNSETDESSILDGTVYTHWERKRRTYLDWSNALEQYAMPKTRIIYPQGTGLYGPDGKPMDEKKEAEYYAQQAEMYRTSTSYAHDEGIDVQTVAGPGTIGSAFREKLDYDDTMILRGMLLPPLLAQGSDGGVGSRALGETHYKFFWDYMKAEIERIAEEIVSQLIRPLITYNFDNTKEYGHFNLDDIGTKDYTAWKDIFMTLVNIGVLAPSVNKIHRKRILEFFNLIDGELSSKEMLNNSLIPQEDLEE
jgi:hypothetical protein